MVSLIHHVMISFRTSFLMPSLQIFRFWLVAGFTFLPRGIATTCGLAPRRRYKVHVGI